MPFARRMRTRDAISTSFRVTRLNTILSVSSHHDYQAEVSDLHLAEFFFPEDIAYGTPGNEVSFTLAAYNNQLKGTDRRFGGPLPRQLANQTRVHLTPPEFFTPGHAALCAYAVLAVISNCYPPV